MEDKKLYKCKEYRITDPGDIIIGTEGNSSDDTVRLSGTKSFFLTFKLIFDDDFDLDQMDFGASRFFSFTAQETRLKSRPVTELDLEKNKKILEAVGKFSVNVFKGLTEAAVKGTPW